MSTVPPPPPPNQPPPYPPPQPGMDPRDYARAQREYYKTWARQQKDYWRAHKDEWRAQRDHWRAQNWYGRRSLVGPIILITLGIILVLVQTGHMEGWRAWEWFGNWWPVILIAAGVGRLIEWAIDHDNPYPRRSGFGGLLVLLIILGLIATGFNHAHRSGWWNNGWNFGDDDDFSVFHGPEHDYEGQFWAAVPAGDSVQIVSSMRGSISVTTADASTPPPPPGQIVNMTGPDVYIRLHKKVHTEDAKNAQREADDFVPVATHSGSVTIIHLDPKSGDVGAGIEISLPAGVALSVQTQHADLTVTGVQGNVATDTHHGDLRFTDLGGSLQVNADHGDVTVSNVHGDLALNGTFGDLNISGVNGSAMLSGDFPGDLNLRNIAGPLHFHSSRTDMDVARIADQLTIDSGDLHGSNLAGPFRLKTRDYNVDLDNVSGDVDITNTNNEVDVVAARPLGSINIDNHSGNIRVTLPQDAGFQLYAETSGEISDDFGIINSDSGSHKIAQGTVGNGALRINLKSNEDDISIRKAADAPLVPATGPMPVNAAQDSPRVLNLPRIPQLPTVPGVPAPRHLHQPPTPPKIAVPQPPEISNQ